MLELESLHTRGHTARERMVPEQAASETGGEALEPRVIERRRHAKSVTWRRRIGKVGMGGVGKK